ncbi:glycosyltransferase family 4 protein, partial [Vibrio parahaemolyticus]|nr:glycosyltransferase family 4 protein [Vibrio parahaemolyticus]
FSKESTFSFLVKSGFFILKFISYIIFNRCRIQSVYLTTSRTSSGFIRDFFVINSCKLLGIPVVNHLHGADFVSFRNRTLFLKPFIDFTYRNINCSIVLSESMKKQYDLYSGMRLEIVSNFFEEPCVKFEKKSTYGVLDILYLSNIIYSKGIFHLIDAVKQLNENGYKVMLNIAGSPMGDEYMSAQDAATLFYDKTKGVDFIKYHGVALNSEKDKLLINADVFCLPSFYKTEAQPISIIEAMASGCLIITTKHNYLTDLVSNNEGLVIEPESVAEIKNALVFAIENPKVLNEVSNHNKTYAIEKYSSSNYLERLSEIVTGRL